MIDIYRTGLWLNCFDEKKYERNSLEVRLLADEFKRIRSRVIPLLSEIGSSLPEFTVHDIDHVDALWESASDLIGDNITLNPLECFILGCSFLFHDAGMSLAAYPGGLSDIKRTLEWKKLSARFGLDVDENHPSFSAVLEIFIREQHAKRAEELPQVFWNSETGHQYIIENSEIRQKFSSIIGAISASHWWDHEKIEAEFQYKILPPPPPFPSDWSIDCLKIACLLRISDAIQIDERRAPGLLFALRQSKISDYSKMHWIFQNKLTKPHIRFDSLFFASTSSFDVSQAKSWWLLYDTLKYVDRELRSTDDTMLRCRPNIGRFAARRISNVEYPSLLANFITVKGWMPVDTEFSISDIPRLISNLGGNQLYGNNKFAPLRELIQNAMDATRLRAIVDPAFKFGKIVIDLQKTLDGFSIKIKDSGVGMTSADIVSKLLSFGNSSWLNDDSIGEYSFIFPHKGDFSGRFGIGFFSIFMLSRSIKIITRRFDKSPKDTIVLHFDDGLNSRPIISSASWEDLMTEGGTSVEAFIMEQDFYSMTERFPDFFKLISSNFPTCDVKIDVKVDSVVKTIDGTRWREEPFRELASRLVVEKDLYDFLEPYFECAEELIDSNGNIVGRACLYPSDIRHHGGFASDPGAIVSNGSVISRGRFIGVLLGRPARASRDDAIIGVEDGEFKRWLSSQAKILSNRPDAAKGELAIAEIVVSLGGDPADLKVCEIGGSYLSGPELQKMLSDIDEIDVVHDSSVYLSKPEGGERTRSAVSVSMGVSYFLQTQNWEESIPTFAGISLEKHVIKIIQREFEIDESVIELTKKIENGRYLHQCYVPVWVSKSGDKINISGKKYKRKMKITEVKDINPISELD